jgi:isopropylmalate/homocitrate/citramalate synthase
MSDENVWYVTDWNNDKMQDWSFAYLKNSQSYLVFYTWDVPIAKVLNKEHAQLIAAAPDMLEALEGLMPWMDLVLQRTMWTYDAEWDQLNKNAKAAIAKAKGEALP